MTRAWSQIWWRRRYLRQKHWRGIFTREFWHNFPRPGYCVACPYIHPVWCWLTHEQAPYSSAYGFVCEECAIRDEEEMEAFWRSHHGYY